MKLRNRIHAWLVARRLERELAEEIHAHREMLEAKFIADAFSPEDARLAAARRFGNASVAFERSRDQWRIRWLDSTVHDVVFALRLLRRQPMLAVAAIVTIALGVGALTAVTSVVRTALVNPLGFHDTARVMVARVRVESVHLRNAETSAVEFAELSAMRDTFSAVAASEGRWWTVEGQNDAERWVGRAVTPHYFRVFNERPFIGRFFTDDDRESLVLSYAAWQSRFGGDRSVIGRAILIDGKPYRVVGVAGDGFRFPNVDAWAPLVIQPARFRQRGYAMMLTVFGRVRDDVTNAQAIDRVNRYVSALKSGPEGGDLIKSGYFVDLRTFAEYVAGDLRRPILLVWVAALLVLVTGCANVAGLLLARSGGRKREIAIRFSLGASGLQVLRQLLVESVVLGCLGGAAGIALAAAGVAAARHVQVPGGLMLTMVRFDGRLVLYAFSAATVTALLFGLAPAIQLLRGNQAAAMVRARHRSQNLFVIAEVAVASMLLVVTVLLLRSLWAVEQVRPGFDPSNVTTAFVIKPQNDVTFLERLRVRLASTAGVQSAAMAYPLPFTNGGLTSGFEIRNRERQPGEPEWHGEAYMISPGYLKTLRIPLLKGRDLADSDLADGPTVCLIDSVFADRFFPGTDPIGQEIAMYKGWARIVGVAAAVRGTALEGLARPVAYYSLAQVPFFPSAAMVVRAAVPAVPVIRQAVRDVNRRAPIFDVQSMEDRVRTSLGVRQVVVEMLAAFALITVLLSAIGVHSVIAQIVADRTPEIGVRMALGARPAQVLRQFLAQGLRAGCIGLALGLAAAAYAQRWIASLLYEIKAYDAATFLVVAVGLLSLLAFAVWWPARRASAIDPQVALRYE